MAGFPSKSKGNQIGEKAKRPHPGIPLDKKVIAQLITQHSGNLSRVADAIGSQRGVIRRICDNDPELKELLLQARERLIDQLEQSCFERAIESNDTGLQAFLLKTQGKSRGYDQSEAGQAAKDIASAAFAFIINKQGGSNAALTPKPPQA